MAAHKSKTPGEACPVLAGVSSLGVRRTESPTLEALAVDVNVLLLVVARDHHAVVEHEGPLPYPAQDQPQ
jgi:hypothetical protein